MPEQITDYFGDGKQFGVKIEYSLETELLGTAGSLLSFKNWLGDEDFLVIYGDILTNQALAPIIALHKKYQTFATLLLHHRKVSNSFIELDANSKIIDFKERPNDEELEKLKLKHPEGFLVNSAVQILSKDCLDYIEEHKCFDLPKDIYSKVLNEKSLYGYVLEGERIAIDSPERYEQAQDASFTA